MALPLFLQPNLFGNGRDRLSASGEHVLVITEDGALFSWGRNSTGQLGTPAGVGEPDGSDSILVPGQVGEDDDWLYVSAGLEHSLAVREDGTLWAWGSNENGQLGIPGVADPLDEPTQVGQGFDWAAVSAGDGFSVALKEDGSLWVWGDNALGQLGRNATQFPSIPTPTKLGDQTWSAISAGAAYVLAIRSDGALFGWGSNSAHQLGLGFLSQAPVSPTRIGGNADWSFIAAANINSFAIKDDGTLWGWGVNGNYQLGLGPDPKPQPTPKKLSTAENWEEIAPGSNHVLGLRTDGTVWGWGFNNSGQLGFPLYNELGQLLSDNTIIESPRQIGTGDTWSRVAAGIAFSAAQEADGQLFTAGANDYGQLGTGSTIPAATLPLDPANLNALSLQPSFFGLPDLSVPSIDFTLQPSTPGGPTPDAPIPGGTIQANISLLNQGTADLPAGLPLMLDLRLSRDQVFSDDDIRLGSPGSAPGPIRFENLGEIQRGLSANVPAELSLPELLDFDDYFIVGNVDPFDVLDNDDFGEIDESIEDNNIGFSEGLLNFPVDLSAEIDDDSVVGGPFEGDDRMLSFDFNVSNLGTGVLPTGRAGEFNYRVVLTRNDVIGDSDDVTPVGGRTLPFNAGLLGGGSARVPVSVEVPRSASPGLYRIALVLDRDSDIIEDDETNNVFLTPGSVVDVRGVDLTAALDAPVVLGEDGDPLDSVPPIVFTSEGAATWFGQDEVVLEAPQLPDGVVNDTAVASPSLEVGESSALTAMIPGPSLLSFWWKADTFSAANFGSFLVNGNVQIDGRISGQTDFVRKTFVLPASLNEVSWVFTQGAETVGDDRVFVDLVTVRRITQPDFVLDNVNFNTGAFVPGQNQLFITVQASNVGDDLPTGQPLPTVRTVLSLDQQIGNSDDIQLGDFQLVQNIGANDRFGFSAIVDIPQRITRTVNIDGATVEEEITIPPGDYHLLSFIDPVDRPNAEDNDFPNDYGIVNESIDRDNNLFVSESRSVNVEPRADLRAVSLEVATLQGSEPNLFLYGDELRVEFRLINEGLSAIAETPFDISVVLSPDRNFDVGEDYVILTTTETAGLPVGQSRTYKFTLQVQPGAPVGEYFHFGVVVDSDDRISEANEANNTTGISKTPNDYDAIIAELSVEEAIEPILSDEEPDITRQIANGPGIGGEDGLRHFIGQSGDAFDASDGTSARSAEIAAGETAAFEFQVESPDENTPGVVSFAWKVSSERTVGTSGDDSQIVKEDYLAFFINGVERKRISGEVGWTIESFQIPPGSSIVRWEYVKDDTGTVGDDAGWVDRIVTESPNLTFIPNPVISLDDQGLVLVTEVPPQGFNRDSDITLGVRLRNEGPADIESSPPFVLEFRLSSDPQFDGEGSANRNDFVLGRVRSDVFPGDPFADGFVAGQQEELEFTFSIPDDIAEAGNYYILAQIDADGAIAESNEDDNIVNTNAILPVSPDVDLATALDFNAVWATSGDATWFGFLDDPFSDNDTHDGVDAARTSPSLGVNQETAIETTVQGPGVLSFYWQVDSVPIQNYLSFSISGIEQDRISGDVPYGIADGTFRLVHASRPTVPIAHNATAAQVEAALESLPTVSGGVSVAGGALLSDGTLEYTVTFDGVADEPQIVVSTGGLNRRVTVTAETLQNGNGATTSEVQRIRISPRQEFFIPAGEQVLRWNFRKRSPNSDPEILDAAWLDEVVFDTGSVSLPDLAIRDIEVEPGTYIVNREDDPDRDKIPVTVFAQNQGAPLSVSLAPSDIEIRLSADEVWGNDDDIQLGEVARTVALDSSGIIVFDGEIELPISTPQGNYFVLAYIDFNERLPEYEPGDYIQYTATDNNLAVSGTRIAVEHRADLDMRDDDSLVFDSLKRYYPENSMKLQFVVENQGLLPISAATSWNVRVSLWAFDIGQDIRALPLDTLLDRAVEVDPDLGDITVNRQLPGASVFNPNGGSTHIQAELTLPTEEQIVDNLPPNRIMESFQYFLIFNLDEGNNILESDERNRLVLLRSFFILEPALLNFNLWAATYGIDPSEMNSDRDGDGLTNLHEYALNRNPLVVDAGGDIWLNWYGFTRIDGEDFLAMTFDMNNLATDLNYFVEVAVGGSFFAPVLEVEPPYQSTHGENSLTGIGGLLDEALVTDVLKLGSEARVTVRDVAPVSLRGDLPVLMRLRIEKE